MYASMCGGPETRVDVKSGSSGSERYIHIYLDDVTITLPTEVALVLAERLRADRVCVHTAEQHLGMMQGLEAGACSAVLGGAAAPKIEADLERL